LYVGVSVVTRADDVSIHFEGSRGKATGTGGITISLFIAFQSVQKILKKRGVPM
jgi:hypothetical protein